LAKAENQEADIESQRQKAMSDALEKYGSDPRAAAMILGQDPRTSEMAMKLMGSELDYDRQKERWGQEDALRREQIASMNSRVSAGSVGAIESLTNRILDSNPNLSFSQALSIAQKGIGQGNYLNEDGTISIFGENPSIPQNTGMPQGQPPIDGISPVSMNQMNAPQGQQPAPIPMPNPMQGQSNAPIGRTYDDVMASREGLIEAEKARQKSRASYMEEGFQQLPKMQRSLQDAEVRGQNIARVASNVEQAAKNSFTTGFTGSITSAVRGSPAFDLKNNLQTLEATAAFDTLQNMRDNSPTGGALGQVSERELDLLKAAYSNLSNSQSYEQLMQNLEAFNLQNQQSLQNARMAYEQDYKRFGGQNDAYLPKLQEQNSPAQPNTQPQGQIAVNPKTGEKMINRGNGWEAYNGN